MRFLKLKRPKLIGRILFVGSLLLAAYFSQIGFLPRPEGTWRSYKISSFERVSSPHHGRVERSYHLRLENQPDMISIAPDEFALFDRGRLTGQSFPVDLEVLSDHESHDGLIRADGVRMSNGSMILDPTQVEHARKPYELIGGAICSLIAVAGIGLHFVKAA